MDRRRRGRSKTSCRFRGVAFEFKTGRAFRQRRHIDAAPRSPPREAKGNVPRRQHECPLGKQTLGHECAPRDPDFTPERRHARRIRSQGQRPARAGTKTQSVFRNQNHDDVYRNSTPVSNGHLSPCRIYLKEYADKARPRGIEPGACDIGEGTARWIHARKKNSSG